MCIYLTYRKQYYNTYNVYIHISLVCYIHMDYIHGNQIYILGSVKNLSAKS